MKERRRDPVTGEWRTFATARQERTFLPPTDQCPLCPTRDVSAPTEIPWSEFEVAVFDNRFPALQADAPPVEGGAGVFDAAPAVGATEVVVYSDVHDASLGTLGRARIRLIVDVWAERYAELGARPEVEYVFIFENRGTAVGVTLSHPHGQIYGYPEVPPLPQRELATARHHQAEHGTCVWCDLVAQERAEGVRVVGYNESFLAFVPFAARFPFEVHIGSHRHAPSLLDLGDPERDALAQMIELVVQRFDALFGFTLPYIMSIHQAPTSDEDWQSISHLHIEFSPLQRSADRLKFLAGSEVGAGAFLNDVGPEDAAARLREAGRHLVERDV